MDLTSLTTGSQLLWLAKEVCPADCPAANVNMVPPVVRPAQITLRFSGPKEAQVNTL